MKAAPNPPQKRPAKNGNSASRLTAYLTGTPIPRIILQLSSRYLSGIRLSPKDRRLESGFLLPLEPGLIQPSFYKPNIPDPGRLDEAFREGARRLGDGGRDVGLLIPEMSQRVFVFVFEQLPSMPEEREQLIRHRIRRQMPLLPEDTRLAFDTLPSGEKKKIVATIARESVVREYEEAAQKIIGKVRMVGVPSLGLFNLLADKPDEDFALVDVEEDSFSFIAVLDSEIYLYRQKPLGAGEEPEEARARKRETVFQEILNTTRLIEDKEKRRIGSLWIRLGFLERDEEIFRDLESRLGLTLRKIEAAGRPEWAERDRMNLSPLIGHIS
jgi:hypothetical protein